MLLYIHVPFCRTKCNYCAFYSEPLVPSEHLLARAAELPGYADLGRERMRLWLDALFMEMARRSDELDRPQVKTVFFGGGTPSLVPPDTIHVIINRIKRYFKLDSKAEITLEVNPESISPASARELVFAGVNRFSLGAQTLDDRQLQLMGRVHGAADVTRAYEALRRAGGRNISLDMIWGLPGQSVNSWLSELKQILELKPDHLSAYALTIEPGTPFAEWVDDGMFLLPKEREQANMYIRGAELLEEAGYIHYEVSNFARMGYQCRHNMGYWEGDDYLGVGPAATSTINGRRWTNLADLQAWSAAVQAGQSWSAGSAGSGSSTVEILSPTDRVLELLMLRLRTCRGLRVKAYTELTGRDFMRDNKTLIHTLHKNGLIRIRHGYLRLTLNGMLVSNSILERMFEAVREQLTPMDFASAKVLHPVGNGPESALDVDELARQQAKAGGEAQCD